MKKIYSIIALTIGCLFMASCSSDDYTEKVNSVQVESAETTIAAIGGTATIQVKGTGISATSAASWLSVAVDGNTIVATATANPMRESRATHITVTASNGDQQLVSVVQYGLVLSLSDSEIDVNGSTHELTIATETTIPVTVTSNTEWITAVYDAENNVINVTIKNNVDENPREGSITVTGEGISETITISQGGIVLELEKDKYVVASNDASTMSVAVTRSIEVQATSDVDWLTPTFNEETSTLELAVAASEELQRSGTVTLTSGSLTKTITIEQYGLYGDYYFLYLDSESGKWYYYAAALSDKGLSYNVNANSPVVLPMAAAEEDYKVTVGPAGTYVGNIIASSGTTYYAYLAWLDSAQGYWSYYDCTESVSGEVVFDNSEGETVQYLDNFAGSWVVDEAEGLTGNADTWLLWVCSAQDFSAASGLGYWDMYTTPYLMKVPASASASRRSATRAIRTKDGHEAMPAVLKNILRPHELKK